MLRSTTIKKTNPDPSALDPNPNPDAEADEWISSWQPLSWSATGTLNIDAGDIKAVAQASIDYKLSDADHDDASTYTIS